MIDFFTQLMYENVAVPNIPRLYTAIAEWFSCLIFVLLAKKRFKTPITVALSVFFFVVLAVLQYFCGSLPIYLWIPGMLGAMVVMFFFIFFVCKVNTLESAYKTVHSFVLAELAASVEWQLNYFLIQTVLNYQFSAWPYVLLVVIYSVLFTAAFFIEKRYFTKKEKIEVERKDLLSSVIIAVIVFAISNISFLTQDTPFSAHYTGEIFYIRTLVDLCGIILFIVLQEKKLWLGERKNVETMQKMLSYQYEQYCLSKESVDIINRKYHDLKNQINVLKEENNEEKRTQYLNRMENEIKMYEAQNKTGNAVLDSILTAKSLLCMKEDINLTSVADGHSLDFMEVMDICSIVGNALDNAIEYEKHFFDKEKRLIKVAICSQGEFLVMRFENYYEGKLELKSGLPLTTKADKENHGFGLKSMQYTAEKYNGLMRIEQHGNWFNLFFLIPFPKSIS